MKEQPKYSFDLCFSIGDIEDLAHDYLKKLPKSEIEKENEIVGLRTQIIERGYLTKSELQKVANWKSPRTKSWISTNSEPFIKEVTSISLSTKNEKLRIEILTLLKGVSWPTASVLLHLYHNNQYPIIDVRALESLSILDSIPYDFEFWEAYYLFCRNLSLNAKVDMRTLDRALWQDSKNKPKK